MKANPEKKVERINPVDPAVVRLVQITDCHIFATADECLQGLNTRHSFERVSNAALGNPANLDLLLATGDLSQDESAAAYEYLAGQFEQFGVPVFWLPGNHDDIDTLREHLTGKQIYPAKRVLVGDWQIVLLDSTVKGQVHGHVSQHQLEFLDNALNQYPDRYALVCLHHQAFDCGSEWLDAKGLKDNDKLRKRITQHNNVRAVLWGHVHQETHQSFDNIEWMSTPSSCVQFKPNSKEFAVGPEKPGYRQLELYPDGTIKTVVHRLQQL
jgi:Icc protein